MDLLVIARVSCRGDLRLARGLAIYDQALVLRRDQQVDLLPRVDVN